MADSKVRMRPVAADRPLTVAVQSALASARNEASKSDLLFLERWEISPLAGSATALRVTQLRRANPELVAQIRAEIAARCK